MLKECIFLRLVFNIIKNKITIVTYYLNYSNDAINDSIWFLRLLRFLNTSKFSIASMYDKII